jgi:hypothetical protein
MAESLLDIQRNRQPVEKLLAKLKSDNRAESAQAGLNLVSEANKYALNLRDYLTLAVETKGTTLSDLSGYEAALVYLNLPVADDFKEGVVLQAASETFQTYPGTRAMFPPVIDDMLQWSTRQGQIEQLDPLLAGSRTISGVELTYTMVNEDGSEFDSFTVPELGRIPVRSLRTSEATVKMFKHGSGIRTSYEFNRRARLDLLTPFAARVQRELTRSKIRAAVNIIVSGDGNSGTAAPVVNQSSFNTAVGKDATAGELSYLHLLKWLVSRAQAGAPVDTVVGNWDSAFQWMKLFQPNANTVISGAEALARMGVTLNLPNMDIPTPKFAIASAAPAGKLIGMIASETLEELKEAGADIQEEERSIQNQSITYLRTETAGFRLVFKDTRSVYDYTA